MLVRYLFGDDEYVSRYDHNLTKRLFCSLRPGCRVSEASEC